VGDYLQHLVERELPANPEGTSDSNGSGMVWEKRLLVTAPERPVPESVVDDLIRRGPREKNRRILGGNR